MKKPFSKLIAVVITVSMLLCMFAVCVSADDPLAPLVTNGRFNDASGWIIAPDYDPTIAQPSDFAEGETAMTIENGKARFHNGDKAWSMIVTELNLEVGARYELSFKAKFESGKTQLKIFNVARYYQHETENQGGYQLAIPDWHYEPDGTLKAVPFTFEPTSETVYIAFKNDGGTCEGWIDDVTVKQIEDVDGNVVAPEYAVEEDHFADYVEPTPGEGEGGEDGGEDGGEGDDGTTSTLPTEIVNGDFSGTDGWTIANVAIPPSIDDGKLVFKNGDTTWGDVTQTIAVEKGEKYLIKFDVLVTEGILRFDLAGAYHWDGTETETKLPSHYDVVLGVQKTVEAEVTAIADELTIRFANADGTCGATIDNVSVTKVAPVRLPTEIVNGDFSGTDGWIIANVATPPSIDDGKLVFENGDTSWGDATQTIAVETGKKYLIKFDVLVTEGVLRFDLAGAYHWDGTETETKLPSHYGVVYGTEMTVESEVTATADELTIRFANAEGTCGATIDNVSVTEVVPVVMPTEIQNGTFDTTDGWIVCADNGSAVADPPVISDGKGVFSATDTAWSGFQQTIAVENGAQYILEFDLSITSGTGIQVTLDGAGSNDLGGGNELNFAGILGTVADGKEYHVKTTLTATATELKIRLKNRMGDTVGYVDNVSIVKYEAPVIPDNPNAGSGIISNGGDFDDAQYWSISSGVTIENGYVVFSGTQNAWTGISQKITLKPNTDYQVFFKHHLTKEKVQVSVDAIGEGGRLIERYLNQWNRNMIATDDGKFNSQNVTEAMLYINSADGDSIAEGVVDFVKIVEIDADGNPIDETGAITEIVDGDNNCLMGDLNGDYNVDLLDMIRMKKVLAGVEIEYNANAANIDTANAQVDAQDIAALKQYVLGFAKPNFALFA